MVDARSGRSASRRDDAARRSRQAQCRQAHRRACGKPCASLALGQNGNLINTGELAALPGEAGADMTLRDEREGAVTRGRIPVPGCINMQDAVHNRDKPGR